MRKAIGHPNGILGRMEPMPMPITPAPIADAV
jgi:hypothetical protein